MKVRIAVVINNLGHWSAYGFHRWDDKMLNDVARDGLDEQAENEQVVFIEADIPVPQSITVEGQIRP